MITNQRLREAISLLKALEWSGHGPDNAHKPDCELARVIGTAVEERERT